jgi:hypothetical protein
MLGVAGVGRLPADEVRYFEKDGVTYRETREVVRRPITQTRLEQRERTVYRDQFTTDMRSQERTYQAPVTEYQWVPTWQRSWNVFVAPSLVYRYVPVTRWEARTEFVRIPVTRRELIPEKRQEQVPVTTQRCVEDVRITQVAIGVRAGGGALPAGTTPEAAGSGSSSVTVGRPTPAAASSDPFAPAAATSMARRDVVGGVSKLESDPPREGSNWRSADSNVRR